MGGPRRHEEQVRRQRPRIGGREHVVLQDELLGVPPVVRDLLGRVVAHDVRLPLRPEVRRALRIRAVIGAVQRAVDHGPDEPVHLPAVDVQLRVTLAVGTPLLQLLMGVIRPYACSGDRVGDADRRPPVPHRDAVGARERPEVVIERTVLLDDEDQVLEVLLGLLELRQVGTGRGRPRRPRRARRRRARLSRPARGRRAGGCEHRGQDERDHEETGAGGVRTHGPPEGTNRRPFGLDLAARQPAAVAARARR